ncbi:hypothetical protein PspR32_10330 [Pseudomonas sp. R32]|nr:hypothetical protein PspR32_10330 [Pseudomonas sp. R32]
MEGRADHTLFAHAYYACGPSPSASEHRLGPFAVIEWLMKHPATTGKVGITGFCYGDGLIAGPAPTLWERACPRSSAKRS